VFTDETWASTNMARRHGRCARGERLRIGVPHGHWKTTTFLGALMLPGFIAAFVLDGPINRDAFETYVEQVLVRELSPGSLVIMDNLLSHKGPRVRDLSKQLAQGCSIARPMVLTSIQSKSLREAQGTAAQSSKVDC
jgi:hypothetical protein